MNDAKALSGLLRRLGFDVVEGFDADRQTLEMLAAEFETKAKVADASLFFFAGHAVQANGQNYLLPIDAVVRSTEDLDRESLILDVVARSMSTKGKLGVVLIDACRDNPFEAALNKNADGGLIVRPIVNGLTEPTVTSSGLLYGFATSFGQTASDGDGDHSPFTSALIKHLPAKGQLIEDVMAQVRYEVIEMTEKRQNPWITTGLLTKFYMNP